MSIFEREKVVHMKLKYLVTGTGRCGTVYMARLLTSLGIPCGHESVFDSSGVEYAIDRLSGNRPLVLSHISQFNCNAENWLELETIMAESSYMAAPFLDHECLRDTIIIHIVRHPVRVVNSFCNYHGYFRAANAQENERCHVWEKFIYGHIPQLQEELSQYDRASLYYVLWNKMITNKLLNRGFLFHKIEDDPRLVLDFLDISADDFFDNRTINTLKKPADFFQTNMIKNDDIRKAFVDIGESYGYNMSECKMI